MKPTDFATHLTRFLVEYLPAQRSVSPNTVKSYRDVFTLLLRFCRDNNGLNPERLTLDHIDPKRVLAFLNHLERERHCGVRTRNHRLSALHAFFRYLQTEDPRRLMQCQQILAIPFQRFQRAEVRYLTPDELAAILAQPNLNIAEGRRDAVMLSLLYDTGARVQELVDIKVRDVRLESPAQVLLHGKGKKTRVVPLLSGTVNLLTEYIHEHRLDKLDSQDLPLFQNRHRTKLSRSGVSYVLGKYAWQANKVRASPEQHISPHTFRHTKAMHLLQAGNPITTIQAILGHADLKTSAIYASADLEMKRAALEKAAGTSPQPTLPSWKQDANLMEWLRSL